MSLPYGLDFVRSAKGYICGPVDYFAVSAYLQGIDACCSGAFLRGFHEMLVVEVGYGNNLAWQALVLELAFPGSVNPQRELRRQEDHEHAIDCLFNDLERFLRLAADDRGRRAIFIFYQRWLERQEWYEPGSPSWVDFDGPGPATHVEAAEVETPPKKGRSRRRTTRKKRKRS